jgi:hypothetical protein
MDFIGHGRWLSVSKTYDRIVVTLIAVQKQIIDKHLDPVSLSGAMVEYLPL